MPRKNLSNAQKDKKYEFYTQYEDIQNELNHYEDKFKNKIVLCNCDDPFESNFFRFFVKNFNYLGLKRLICTCYKGSPVAFTIFDYLKDDNEEPLEKSNGYVIDINEVPMKNGRGVSDDDINKLLVSKKRGVKKLKGDGDFRSAECIEYLKQADIVVTNPPFGLFREYVAQLIEFNKDFIIIGHQNAISYKEIFKLIKENKIWLGYGFKGGAGFFYSPYEDIAKATHHKEGLIRVSGVNWFTNVDIQKRHEDLILYKTYNEEEYPKYDNYDAINVNKTELIPKDYSGVMGVPITFMDKYNPGQFEIVGMGVLLDNFTPNKQYLNPKKVLPDGKVLNGSAVNSMVVIEVNKKPINQVYYISDNSKYLIAPYARILIRNKKVL